ncbi:S9 family peptidase [Amnibacterium kyonggiense]|uniref:Acyl-peptide hydrolase n=1 Tax=Amnibacterium kyonggiense TaxID=595671 RepID=A0A4R7FKT3_9MICO|nr:prolyl oligopeptidase family serine peptidase [Amnibacterium kyonggiense]TDS76976.1 dipeptidyl aminopeptidase/acylaminoacyl peptidase [Amnibacterium kyonggiense]
MTDTATDDRIDAAVRLGDELVGVWGSWCPTMTPDAKRVAFISDRSGAPEVWVQEVVLTGEAPPAQRIPLSADPVIAVSWSADSRWLACTVATDGGVRTQVWVVRPDGSEARRIAGDHDEHAELGPWTRSGHRVVVTFPSPAPGRPTRSFLADPRTGRLDPLAEGDLVHVLDVSLEERFLILLDGERGRQFCSVVDRLEDQHFPLLPSGTGSTDTALVRPAPEGESGPLYVYLASDVGLSRRQLIGLPFGPNGHRGEPRTLAYRDDAELEAVDADDAGELLLLVWNTAGRSELELFHTATHERQPITGMPGLVATTPVLSRDGGSVILGVEGPERSNELWHLDTHSRRWTRVTAAPEPQSRLVVPTLETFHGEDGLPLTGWLYRAAGSRAAVVFLHGGPEAQERPTFSPQHQALAAAGVSVFGVNIRGSSGFGREFVHADDLGGRFDAFGDVRAAAHHLVASGVADRRRIGVTGRSYGGYLTLASLAFSPGVFAAGVDVCGMSDLTRFYEETEPWIGAAAVTKYGHPERDRALLEAISPLRQAEAIDVPLLVVHGELDTNVPVGEARRIVDALQRLDRPVEYLELPGEGHEYRRAASRRRLLHALVRFLATHL